MRGGPGGRDPLAPRALGFGGQPVRSRVLPSSGLLKIEHSELKRYRRVTVG